MIPFHSRLLNDEMADLTGGRAHSQASLKNKRDRLPQELSAHTVRTLSLATAVTQSPAQRLCYALDVTVALCNELRSASSGQIYVLQMSVFLKPPT